jgi:hypothetical protein
VRVQTNFDPAESVYGLLEFRLQVKTDLEVASAYCSLSDGLHQYPITVSVSHSLCPYVASRRAQLTKNPGKENSYSGMLCINSSYLKPGPRVARFVVQAGGLSFTEEVGTTTVPFVHIIAPYHSVSRADYFLLFFLGDSSRSRDTAGQLLRPRRTERSRHHTA